MQNQHIEEFDKLLNSQPLSLIRWNIFLIFIVFGTATILSGIIKFRNVNKDFVNVISIRVRSDRSANLVLRFNSNLQFKKGLVYQVNLIMSPFKRKEKLTLRFLEMSGNRTGSFLLIKPGQKTLLNQPFSNQVNGYLYEAEIFGEERSLLARGRDIKQWLHIPGF